MHPTGSRWTAAIALSVLGLLSFLARTFIDYRFVYEEIGLSTGSLGLVTLFNLALFGGWIWALIAASHGGRRAMYVVAGYDLLLVAFGAATVISFCPSPCRTGWPVGEIIIWSNLVVGIPAAILAAMSLVRGTRSTP